MSHGSGSLLMNEATVCSTRGGRCSSAPLQLLYWRGGLSSQQLIAALIKWTCQGRGLVHGWEESVALPLHPDRVFKMSDNWDFFTNFVPLHLPPFNDFVSDYSTHILIFKQCEISGVRFKAEISDANCPVIEKKNVYMTFFNLYFHFPFQYVWKTNTSWEHQNLWLPVLSAIFSFCTTLGAVKHNYSLPAVLLPFQCRLTDSKKYRLYNNSHE